MIYLDHAATTPISETALEVYNSVAQKYFGNANSLHDHGSSARQILEASAQNIANTLKVRGRDIYFTSGASEANYLSILSILKGNREKGKHLITTQVEHSSVVNVFTKLEEDGYEVSRLSVDKFGRINMKELESVVRDDTVLASIQHVNSETGTFQDLQVIGTILRNRDVIFHSDCVQGYGKLDLDLSVLPVDAISISAHKIYGPKGVGAVWMHPNVKWKSFLPGPTDGKGFRPGTSDVPSIAAFAAAAKQAHQTWKEEQERMLQFRSEFLKALRKTELSFEVEGHPEHVVPNILGLRFHGMEGQFLMLECSQAGLAISTGSACQVGMNLPNRIMTATGKSEQEAREFVRLSFGKENDAQQIPLIIEKMNTILKRHFEKIYNRTKETQK